MIRSDFVSRTAAALVLAVCLLALAPLRPGFAQSAPIEDLAAFPRTKLEIHSRTQPPSVQSFDVWIANTPARQEQGLMYVRDLPAGQGMIFPEQPPRVMNMWMKNCYISMDMVFISPQGRISKIIARAKPMSEDTLSSDTPVGAVLEIGAGEAARLQLRVGDRVSWSEGQMRAPAA